MTGLDLLSGLIEADEVYLGRHENNQHAGKKAKRKKVAVVGIKDRETGQVRVY